MFIVQMRCSESAHPQRLVQVMYDHEEGQIEVIQEPLHTNPGDDESDEVPPRVALLYW